MKTVIGQYSRNPEMLALSIFFDQFKDLIPEAIDDLKNTSYYYMLERCCLIVDKGLKVDEMAKTQPAEYRNMYRELGLSPDQLEDDYTKELRSKYQESLKDWARRWNLGEDVWEENHGGITGLASGEIRSMINPLIMAAYSEYDPIEQLINERIRKYEGKNLPSKEVVKQMYSPQEMEKMYGPEWRDKVERDGQTWEETVELMSMPTDEEDPALFEKLYNKLKNMLPDKHVVIVPDKMELIFYNEGWNPNIESRADAVKRIKASFDSYLELYMDWKESEAGQRGLQPVPNSMRRNLTNSRYRFEWLIFHQVRRWSKNKIAKHYGVDRNAVQESIKTEAKLIGLKLSQPNTANVTH